MTDIKLLSNSQSEIYRPSRWSIIRRRFAAVVLILGAIGCIVYGAFFQTIKATERREEKISVFVPKPFQPNAMPGQGPFVPERPPTQAVKTVNVAHLLSESRVIFLATFGGIVREPSGNIRVTSNGTKGPALCPT